MLIHRWTSVVLLMLCASVAHADACHDAIGNFEYARASELAQAQLIAVPTDFSARMCAARAAYETGRFPDALLHLRAVELQRPQGDERTYLYNWLTVTLRKLGREREAALFGQAALAWARREDSQQNLATALHNLAGLVHAQGDAATAMVFYQESIQINPDLAERSASLNNLGLIQLAQGDFESAEKWLREAIALNREHGHFHHLGKHLMNLGNLYREAKKFEEARTSFDEGAALIERAGDQYWRAVEARYRGWLARDQHDWAQAGRWLALAARTYDMAGARLEGNAAREELSRL